MWTVATYVLRQRLRGVKRYPLVLMLEPLFRCNLACAGCGKIQYPADILQQNLTPEQCFKAVDECGAPMVSHPRRRAAAASADRRDRRRTGRAQEVHLPLHERPAAGRRAATIQADEVPVASPSTWTASAKSTTSPSAAKGRTTSPSQAIKAAVQARLPRDDEHDAVRRRRSRPRPRASSTR